jgi:hypothetical protein
MTEPQARLLPANDRRPRAANGQYVHKLTQGLVDSICGAIATGSTQRDAAVLNGVDEQSFYNWMANGRGGSGRRIERVLVAEVDKAWARRKQMRVSRIQAHGEKDWRADAFLLEREFPDEYGPRTRTTVDANVQHDHRHTLDLGALSLDQKRQMLELLRAGRANDDVIDGEVIELPRGES